MPPPSPRRLTIDEYRKEQGVEEYDELARGWRQLILKKKSSGPSIGKPTKRSLQLFFMACYDTDRFREFIISEGFTELYDIPPEKMRKLLTNDTEMMLFGFRFLKQVLFGENTIALHQEMAATRLGKSREKMQKLEEEARAKRATESDAMYDDPD
ncbi:MAG: hypothetical protein Q8O64_09330 [Sideroxyarcus sp.]|nr:hypothetical protein [Sideroxyarcus sp.]